MISDIRMPDINGIDLAKNIREINNEIKIFLMSAALLHNSLFSGYHLDYHVIFF